MCPDDRRQERQVAMAENQVGQDRQPVAQQAARQGSHECRAAGDACQDELAANAGFHEAEAAGHQRQEPDDVRRRIRQQDKQWLRVTAGRAQRAEQAAEVEADTACAQEQRLAPPASQWDTPVTAPSLAYRPMKALTASSRAPIWKETYLSHPIPQAVRMPRAHALPSRIRVRAPNALYGGDECGRQDLD